MKRLILLLSLILPPGASAQSTSSVAPATATNAPPAVTSAPAKPPLLPPSTTTPDNARYVKNPQMLRQLEADLTAIQGKPCDIIFIGDSITAGWKGAGTAIWQKDYAPRNALDFGISGDGTQHVLWRLENMNVKGLKPKVAVIMIGTNNIGNTSQQIADGVKAVIAQTQSAFPGVKIILLSITSNKRANDKMMATDAIIKSYADHQSVYWLDLVPLMPPVTTTTPDGKTDTNWKGLKPDHLHPDASGYQIWHDAMEPLLSKLRAGG